MAPSSEDSQDGPEQVPSESSHDGLVVRFLKRAYTVPPTPRNYFVSAIVFYLSQLANLINAVLAAQQNKFESAALLVFGILAPGSINGFRIYFRMQLSDSTKDLAFGACMRSILNVDRAYDAWKYLMRGEQPRWDNVAGVLYTQLAFCNVPTSSVNLFTAASGAMQDGLNTFLLILSSLSILLGVFHTFPQHYSKGPPTNFDKYRLFNTTGPNSGREVVAVFLTDTSAMLYRFGLCALLYNSAGGLVLLLYLLISGGIQYTLFAETIFKIFRAQTGTPVAAGMVFGNMVVDQNFEPVAAMEVYQRQHYWFRLVQTSAGICLVVMHADVLLALPGQVYVLPVIVCTTVFFLTWTITTAIVYYGMFKERREEKRWMAHAFFSMMIEKAKKKQEDAQAAADQSQVQESPISSASAPEA